MTVRFYFLSAEELKEGRQRNKCVCVSVCVSVCVCLCVCVLVPHCVQLFAIPWPVVHQALLSMDFSRQEYWNE